MTTIVTVHSHRGGTGKSFLAANLARQMVDRGLDVLVVDTNVQAPAMHVFLGVPNQRVDRGLSDYLLGAGEIHDLLLEVPLGSGTARLLPSRLSADVIASVVGRGYDPGLLDDGLRQLASDLRPDVMLLDTSAGMTNETMVSLALADRLLLLARPEHQDLEGARVTMSVVRRLSCPRIMLLANRVPASSRPLARDALETAYGLPVHAMLDTVDAGAAQDLLAPPHPDGDLHDQLLRLSTEVLAPVAGDIRGTDTGGVRP